MLGLSVISLLFMAHIMRIREKVKSCMAKKVADTCTSQEVSRKEIEAQDNPVIIAANETQTVTKKDNTDSTLDWFKWWREYQGNLDL